MSLIPHVGARIPHVASGCVPFFLDNFDGTGLLSAHTPDTAPSGFAWDLNSVGTMTLNGAGKVAPTSGTATQYNSIAASQGWTPVPVGAVFTVTLVATMPG